MPLVDILLWYNYVMQTNKMHALHINVFILIFSDLK